ncbi:hypothetical protein ART_0436 [Arthrobacter sp. PAMC 25486]|uniref:hypothetical protein n=1 Tax=Arthrobacter sp. PAMC 25486 TaxID=1494608 RepID=UPI00053602FC|nr:hypothetical protein [Arthrobacter sp. PAMC 25486]AIY00035.1 hypothetical protein ART_0436 [Arthrobacter sp. PAMC 25486]
MTADGTAAGHSVNEEPGDIMLYTDTAYTGEIGIELDMAGTKVSEYLAANEDVFAGGTSPLTPHISV